MHTFVSLRCDFLLQDEVFLSLQASSSLTSSMFDSDSPGGQEVSVPEMNWDFFSPFFFARFYGAHKSVSNNVMAESVVSVQQRKTAGRRL